MKKRYKGYFKKKTNTLEEVRFKKMLMKEFQFTEKRRAFWIVGRRVSKNINKL